MNYFSAIPLRVMNLFTLFFDAGHQLPVKYVSNLLDTWLNSDG